MVTEYQLSSGEYWDTDDCGGHLSAIKQVTGTFEPLGEVTYTITLRNEGPGDHADNPGPELEDVLPGALPRLLSKAVGRAAHLSLAGHVPRP